MESRKTERRSGAGEALEWAEGYDEQHGAFFYFNRRTRRRQWRKPNAPYRAYERESDGSGD